MQAWERWLTQHQSKYNGATVELIQKYADYLNALNTIINEQTDRLDTVESQFEPLENKVVTLVQSETPSDTEQYSPGTIWFVTEQE